jgi:hypothetical protein
MAHQQVTHRFGPDTWATVGATGKHVRVEIWSKIANAYRVHSAADGVEFFQEDELTEVVAYPDEDFTRHWSRCRRIGCGAPLTAELPTCETCKGPICTCGRCACASSKTKKAAKKRAKKVAKPVGEAVAPE